MSTDSTPILDDIVAAAKAAPPKVQLEEYREAVEALREKGYSWREVAAFLAERGVVTDHTRIYRHFGKPAKEKRRIEEKPVEVGRMTYLGEKPTKKRNGAWKVMQVELPSKLGAPITVKGFAWGSASPFSVGADNALSYRETSLVTRTGNRGFPVASLRAELRTEDGEWVAQEIYIAPEWDALL